MKVLIVIIHALFLIGLFSGCGDHGAVNYTGDDNETVNYAGWAVGSSIDGYGTIIHTTDSGKVWEREGNTTTIPNVSINDVAAVDQLNIWVVGGSSLDINGTSYGTILHSDNAGKSWERQGTSESIPDEEFIGISAVNGQLAWSVGTGGIIIHTDDGGRNWHQQAEGIFQDVTFQMVSAVDKDNVWAVGSEGGVDAIIARTTNGDDWERININILEGVQVLIDVHAVSADIVWAVGTDGTVAITINGGESWVRTGPPAGILHVNGVCALDEKRAWIAVDSYSVYYTSDGGFSWTKQNLVNTDIPGLSGAYMGVTAIDENNVWLVGLNSPQMEIKPVILHTVDGGQMWTEQSSPANSYLRRVSFVGDVRN